jgi:hypothetical protein
MWSDFKTRFSSILTNLSRHSKLIESQARLVHYEQYEVDTLNTFEKLAAIERTQMETKIMLQEKEKEMRKKRLSDVLGWVAGPEASKDHNSTCEMRRDYGNTGLWILKHRQVLRWLDEEFPRQPLLWLNGIPGAG